MERRAFLGHMTKGAAVAALGVSVISLDGCNVLDTIESWIPTGEAAVNAILAVLTANNIPVSAAVSTIVGLIETGLNDLLAAIKEYESTTPPPQGVLAKIQTIMQDISDQFSNFVSQLSGVAGGILKVVTSLAEVVITTIAGFVNELTPSTQTVSFKFSGAPVVAIKRSRRKFAHDWNSQLDAAKAVGVQVPKEAYLHVSLL